MHLEADGPGSGLALALASGALSETGEIFLANSFRSEVLIEILAAAVIDVDFEVHLGFAVKAFEVALELALVRADGLAERFIVLKDSPKTERKDCRLFEAVGDYPGVIHAGFLVHGLRGVMFADDDS
jgi:hypothetical protein